MTASEFAFLALGLVLGIAGGAALIEVLRARPPVARQVRLTVSPNAIQPRLSSTLADSLPPGEASGPARGGPGDRRLAEPPDAAPAARTARRRLDDEPAVEDSRSGSGRTPVLAPHPGRPAPAVPTAQANASAGRPDAPVTSEPAQPAADRPEPLWLRPAAGQTGNLVAVPMLLEPDPLTSALRATAAGSAVAAMAGDRAGSTLGGATESAARARATIDRPASASPEPGASAGPMSAEPADRQAAPSNGPCAEERRVAEERCAFAVRARAMADQAADTLHRSQRTYDDHVARAEAAAAAADPRSVRAAKERAQQRFRDARLHARTRDDVEAAARTWLAEINQINHDTREAVLGTERDRSAAAALGPALERLAVEADAARISAEQADEACLAARDAVAACDEARALEVAAARVAGQPAPDAPGLPGGSTAPDGEVAATARIAPATPEPEDEFEFSTPMGSRAGHDPVIIRILRGDHAAMDRAVARLAGDDPDARRRWEGLLGSLVEALIDRSIEASAFDFPTEHPFWGPFSQAQCRDITAGLSSLGYHFDGLGGWVDERLPGQRDLSLAVGYAGLDPMRIRHWPTADETRDLLRDVQVAADEYVAGAAGGLTLGELLTLLGRRADAMTELWNEWGTVRPVLLDAA